MTKDSPTEIRKAAGFTRAQIADRLGISTQRVDEIETTGVWDASLMLAYYRACNEASEGEAKSCPP